MDSHQIVNQPGIVTDVRSDDEVKPLSPWLNWLPRLSRILVRTEGVLGQRATGLVLGLLLLAIGAFYVTPATWLVNNGGAYGDISFDPFLQDGNAFRHRILSPLIAYYLHLRGHAYFIYFPLIVTVIFLGAIYSHFRRLGHSQLSSLLASSTMAFSGPTLFLLHFQGYTDITSHLLLFWCFVLRRSKILWVLLLALAMLNHEASAFSIPWLLFMRTHYRRSPLFSVRGILLATLDTILAALSVVPLLLLKHYWPLQNNALQADYYLSGISKMWELIFPYAGFGIFEAFKLFWFVPLFALMTAERGTRCYTFVVFTLMFLAGVAQLAVSHDISRHVHHSFPIVLYGLEMLMRKKWWGRRAEEVLVILIFCNFVVPQYYIGQRNAWPFLPVPVSFIMWLFGHNPWGYHFMPWN